MSAPTRKTPRKAAAKKTPPAPPSAPAEAGPALSDEDLQALASTEGQTGAPSGGVKPVIIGKRGRRGDTPVEMITIFELDDVPYQIPKNPSAALVLQWLLEVQEMGMAEANSRMGLQLLGKEPMRALAASPEVEPEDLYEIFSNIGAVFFASDNYAKIMAAPDPS